MKKRRKNKEIISCLVITAIWLLIAAAAFSWSAQLMLCGKLEENTGEIVWFQERDVEALVYGHDSDADFVPGIYTGNLIVSPEEDFYNTIELMARVVEAEAANQGLLGKRMVADVILNRVKDKEFPNTIVDVIYQENAFAVINSGMYMQVEVSEETWEAIHMELEEISYPGLFYFCSTGFHEYGTPWKKVEDHYFNTK